MYDFVFSSRSSFRISMYPNVRIESKNKQPAEFKPAAFRAGFGSGHGTRGITSQHLLINHRQAAIMTGRERLDAVSHGRSGFVSRLDCRAVNIMAALATGITRV